MLSFSTHHVSLSQCTKRLQCVRPYMVAKQFKCTYNLYRKLTVWHSASFFWRWDCANRKFMEYVRLLLTKAPITRLLCWKFGEGHGFFWHCRSWFGLWDHIQLHGLTSEGLFIGTWWLFLRSFLLNWRIHTLRWRRLIAKWIIHGSVRMPSSILIIPT